MIFLGGRSKCSEQKDLGERVSGDCMGVAFSGSRFAKQSRCAKSLGGRRTVLMAGDRRVSRTGILGSVDKEERRGLGTSPWGGGRNLPRIPQSVGGSSPSRSPGQGGLSREGPWESGQGCCSKGSAGRQDSPGEVPAE